MTEIKTNINTDIATRLTNFYRTLPEPSPAEDRKELTPDEFWQTMRMMADANLGCMRYSEKEAEETENEAKKPSEVPAKKPVKKIL